MKPDRGALVLLPFPFSDLSAKKTRPAIVVSPDRVHDWTHDRVVVAVTSSLSAGNASDRVPLTSRDMARGKLPRPSVALLTKLFTIHRSLVIREVGRLKDSSLLSILERLRGFFTP